MIMRLPQARGPSTSSSTSPLIGSVLAWRRMTVFFAISANQSTHGPFGWIAACPGDRLGGAGLADLAHLVDLEAPHDLVGLGAVLHGGDRVGGDDLIVGRLFLGQIKARAVAQRRLQADFVKERALLDLGAVDDVDLEAIDVTGLQDLLPAARRPSACTGPA
jgi:hypothetical protein